MGKSNRGQYGSSKASKPKKLHGKREKTAVSPPEASFHPSDIDFKAPPKDLNEEQAEADVATTLALVLACAAHIDAGELSLPLAALLADPRLVPKTSDDAWYPTPKALARVANTVTAAFEKEGRKSDSPFPRFYNLKDYTPAAIKLREKSSTGA